MILRSPCLQQPGLGGDDFAEVAAAPCTFCALLGRTDTASAAQMHNSHKGPGSPESARSRSTTTATMKHPTQRKSSQSVASSDHAGRPVHKHGRANAKLAVNVATAKAIDEYLGIEMLNASMLKDSRVKAKSGPARPFASAATSDAPTTKSTEIPCTTMTAREGDRIVVTWKEPPNETGFCCAVTAQTVILITIRRSPRQQQPGLARGLAERRCVHGEIVR